MRVFFAIFIFPLILNAQDKIPYKNGEYSAYNISYRGIKVGSAELEILNEIEINNVSVFHIVGKGRTTPFFDFFFKVRDVYETYLDTLKIRPVKFSRNIQEGSYKKQQIYRFEHSDSLVFFKDTAYMISKNTQDMLSAFFFARTFNKENLFKNKSFFIPIFMDEENYFLEITYLYNEIIETTLGEVDCMVLKPKMQEGRVFQDGEKMKVWISDDKNRLLIKVETEIWSGTIKAMIVKQNGSKHPLSIIK